MRDLRLKRPRCFVLFTRLLLTLIVLSLTIPAWTLQAQQQSSLYKLSPALQQAMVSTNELIWSNQNARTVRLLIQTYGPVSATLIAAIALQGGSVVRQFTSIDGLLAEVQPKNCYRSRIATTWSA